MLPPTWSTINWLSSITDLQASKSLLHYGRLVARCIIGEGSLYCAPAYRLIIVDKAAVLVSEFQLTENVLGDPVAFVSALNQSIEDVEEEDP